MQLTNQNLDENERVLILDVDHYKLPTNVHI